MTDWFDIPVSIDADAAAIIAQGMRAVAKADGVIHHRELNLIASFEASLPPGHEPRGRLASANLETAYVRSLVMVALADGVITDAELARIRELCTEQGIDSERLDAEILSVKRRFLSVFAGVNFFRDAVVRVARDLGLSEAEVEALAQEA